MPRPNLVRSIQALTGITVAALARKIGVSGAQLQGWREGRAVPPAAALALRTFLEHARESRHAGSTRRSSPPLEQGLLEGESLELLRALPDDAVDMILSDIPYGIGHDDWDVLHANRNSAYLGQSEAQRRAGPVFAKRHKPINGWSAADRAIPREYEAWCREWAGEWLRVLKPGASAVIFAGRRLAHRCVVALEDSGFNYRDMLAWERPRAVFRAQRLSTVLRKRGELDEAAHWEGWRLGNLRPLFEPVLWLFKPYSHTLVDNVLDYGVGAFNLEAFAASSAGSSNLIRAGFRPGEAGQHPAQKPLDLLRPLIELCCPPGGLVLDPFAGSGSTGVAALEAGCRYLLIERDPATAALARGRLGDGRR